MLKGADNCNKPISMVNPENIIDSFHSASPANQELITTLFNPNSDQKIYLLGQNEQSKALCDRIEISGIVNDFEKDKLYWNGKVIISSSEIPIGSIVINCSTSISPISAAKNLTKLKHITVLAFSDLIKLKEHKSLIPEFVLEARKDLCDHTEKYEHIFSILSDKESKAVFNKLLSFRLTADANYMQGFHVRPHEQYFEPFIGKLIDASFVDCGGYDGDTTEEFISRYPKYSKVYLFEPSSTNMLRAKERLKDKKNIDFIPLGVSDTSGTLSFEADLGSACSVSTEGAVSIEVTTLDDYTDEELSFIKMDLEGWEQNALSGARRHIKNDRPIMAIAVYHTISDFWKIPNLILEINPGYKLYLRHYTEGWSETVMYFVPE